MALLEQFSLSAITRFDFLLAILRFLYGTLIWSPTVLSKHVPLVSLGFLYSFLLSIR